MTYAELQMRTKVIERDLERLQKEIKEAEAWVRIEVILFITLFLFVSYVALFK